MVSEIIDRNNVEDLEFDEMRGLLEAICANLGQE